MGGVEGATKYADSAKESAKLQFRDKSYTSVG